METKLLFDTKPLVIDPALAKAIGLNEAIILQQLHYWLQKSSHSHDGRKWVYNSVRQWEEQFPFWSGTTVKRTLRSLEKAGLIETAAFNRQTFDRTKWYTINYRALEQLLQSGRDVANRLGQNDPIEQVKMTQPIPETTTETTKETHEVPDGTSCAAEPEAPPEPANRMVDHDSSGKPKRKRTRDPNLAHPAVQAWAKASGTPAYRLNKRQRAMIAAHIRGDPDAAGAWRASVEHWLEHGWNPVNIRGQIEFHERGGAEACGLCQRPARGGRNGKVRDSGANDPAVSRAEYNPADFVTLDESDHEDQEWHSMSGMP